MRTCCDLIIIEIEEENTKDAAYEAKGDIYSKTQIAH